MLMFETYEQRKRVRNWEMKRRILFLYLMFNQFHIVLFSTYLDSFININSCYCKFLNCKYSAVSSVFYVWSDDNRSCFFVIKSEFIKNLKLWMIVYIIKFRMTFFSSFDQHFVILSIQFDLLSIPFCRSCV